MTFLQKIKARIVDKFSGGVGTKDIGKQLDSLVSEDRDYALKHLPYHMVEAARFEQMHQWLTDFDFINAKVSASGVQALIEDYDLVFNPDVLLSEEKSETLRLIQGAIRLSAHVLDKDETQLAGQMLGRLLSFEVPQIQAMLEQAKQGKNVPWLRPLSPSLIPPDESLLRTMIGHEDLILAVAISQGGQKALSGSANGILKLWDLTKGIEKWTISSQSELVLAVAISQDGRRGLSGLADGTLKLWDLDSGTECRILTGHANKINTVAMTPDGQWALSGSADCTLKLWDLENGWELYTLTGHHGSVTSIAMTPDRQWAISGSWDRTLKLWDLNSGIVLQTVKLWEKASQIYATPKSWNSKNIIDIYASQEFGSGSAWHFPNSQGDRVMAVAMTPDVRWAVSGSDDGIVTLWDLTSGIDKYNLTGHSEGVMAVAVNPDGRRAISASFDGTLKLWDLTNGKELRTLSGHSGGVNAVAVTPDWQWAVSGSDDRTLKLWNLSSDLVNSHIAGHSGRVNAVAVTPDGQWAVSGSDDCTLKLWDLSSCTQKLTLTNHTDAVKAVAVTPKGLIVSGSDDDTLKLWNLASDREPRTLNSQDSWVAPMAVTPDGQWIVSVLNQGNPALWNVVSGKKHRTLIDYTGWFWFTIPPPNYQVNAIAVTPDGQWALFGSNYGITLWNLYSGNQEWAITDLPSTVRTLTVTSDWKLLYGLDDGSLEMWNLVDGTKRPSLIGHSSGVSAVAVTADEQYVISASDDSTLKVWDLESGKVITSFNGDGALMCCAVAPDELTIVAGEVSGRVHFLRLEGV